MRRRRRQLGPAQRIAAANAIAERLLGLEFAPQQGHVAGYWAMDGEIALHVWQLNLPSNCVYCLPALNGNELAFVPWRPGDPLVTNRYGIPEPAATSATLLRPEDMALVVAPLVAFDASGARLGMGGGWYDRSFTFRRNRSAPPWLVGVGFELQRLERIDTAEWDVPLDAVCSEAGTYDTNQQSSDKGDP